MMQPYYTKPYHFNHTEEEQVAEADTRRRVMLHPEYRSTIQTASSVTLRRLYEKNMLLSMSMSTCTTASMEMDISMSTSASKRSRDGDDGIFESPRSVMLTNYPHSGDVMLARNPSEYSLPFEGGNDDSLSVRSDSFLPSLSSLRFMTEVEEKDVDVDKEAQPPVEYRITRGLDSLVGVAATTATVNTCTNENRNKIVNSSPGQCKRKQELPDHDGSQTCGNETLTAFVRRILSPLVDTNKHQDCLLDRNATNTNTMPPSPSSSSTMTERRRRRFRRKLSSNLIFVQQIRSELITHQDPNENDDQRRAARANRLLLTGSIGSALFSPLDAAFETNLSDATLLDPTSVPPPSTDKSVPVVSDDNTDTTSITKPKQNFLSKAFSSLSSFTCFISDDKQTEPEEEEEDEYQHDPIEIKAEPPQDLETSPRILSPNLMQILSDNALPSTLRVKQWERLFSITRDGDSFDTFLQKVKGHEQTVLVLRTGGEEEVVIGAFADSQWERSRTKRDGTSFYGGGKSFLFRVDTENDSDRTSDVTASTEVETVSLQSSEENDHDHHHDDMSFPIATHSHAFPNTTTTTFSQVKDEEAYYPLPSTYQSSSKSKSSSSSNNDKITVYHWQGTNDYNQFCKVQEGMIAMGGGGSSSSFGLCIQDYFSYGTTGPCDTYGTRRGSLTFQDRFEVVEFEVYGFSYLW